MRLPVCLCFCKELLACKPQGCDECGKEAHTQDENDALRTGWLHRHGCTLQRCERWSLLLKFGTHGFKLCAHGAICVKLQLHLVLQFVALREERLQHHVLVGIAVCAIYLRAVFVLLLRLYCKFLVVFYIYAGFVGAIACDEVLKMHTNRVGHRGADKRILVFYLYGYHLCLLIYVATDVAYYFLEQRSIFSDIRNGSICAPVRKPFVFSFFLKQEVTLRITYLNGAVIGFFS